MDRPSGSAILIGLASQDSAVSRAAAVALMSLVRDEGSDPVVTLPQRAVTVLEAQWHPVTDRDELLIDLRRAMVDPSTDLLTVNLLAYALASAGEDGVTELVGLLDHSDFSIRSYAAEGVGSLDNRARWAIPALCRRLERARADWAGFTLIRALGNIGGQEAINVLQSVTKRARQSASPDIHLLEAVESALAAAITQE